MNLRDQIILDTILPDLPPSVNTLYATVNGRRVKSAEGRKFAKKVAGWLETETERLAGHFPADGHAHANRLELFIFFFLPPFILNQKTGQFEKNTALSSSDSDGRLKAGKDSVITALGFDVKGKELNDNRVYADHTLKWEGRPDLLDKYPLGYTRVILARFGFAPEILSVFRNELKRIETETEARKGQLNEQRRERRKRLHAQALWGGSGSQPGQD